MWAAVFMLKKAAHTQMVKWHWQWHNGETNLSLPSSLSVSIVIIKMTHNGSIVSHICFFFFFLVSSYSAARLCSLFNLKDTQVPRHYLWWLFVLSFRIPLPSIPFMRGIIYFMLLLLHVKQGLNWSQVLVSNTVFMVGHFPTETSDSGDVLFCTACYLLPNNSWKICLCKDRHLVVLMEGWKQNRQLPGPAQLITKQFPEQAACCRPSLSGSSATSPLWSL